MKVPKPFSHIFPALCHCLKIIGIPDVPGFRNLSRFARISNSSPVYLISPYYMHNCKNLLTVVYCTHCCADTVTKRVTANFQSKYNGGFSWPHSFSHPYTS